MDCMCTFKALKCWKYLVIVDFQYEAESRNFWSFEMFELRTIWFMESIFHKNANISKNAVYLRKTKHVMLRGLKFCINRSYIVIFNARKEIMAALSFSHRSIFFLHLAQSSKNWFGVNWKNGMGQKQKSYHYSSSKGWKLIGTKISPLPPLIFRIKSRHYLGILVFL